MADKDEDECASTSQNDNAEKPVVEAATESLQETPLNPILPGNEAPPAVVKDKTKSKIYLTF